MSYNIVHDDGSNPQLWNNLSANGIRSNSLYSLTINTQALVTNTVQSNSITTPLLNATSIISNDADINEIKVGELRFSPYATENKLARYYSYEYNNSVLSAFSPISQIADIHYELIGKSCNLLIIPVTASVFINNRRYLEPQTVDSINISFSELGSGISTQLYNSLDTLYVIQGTGYYLDTSGGNQVRRTYNWGIRKGNNISGSFIQLTKEDFNEFTLSPGWSGSDKIFSICISFCTIN